MFIVYYVKLRACYVKVKQPKKGFRDNVEDGNTGILPQQAS